MWRGGRSAYMLVALVAIAVANGLFLGLTVYALLAAVLRVVHGSAPGLGYAFLIGAVSANYLLIVSLQRERSLRQGEYKLWTPMLPGEAEHPLVARLRGLTAAGSLDRPPTLGCVESPERNAFTVGRSRDEASIVVTTGLIDGLTRPELDAVLAQQLAHVEHDDVKAAGFADAIADSIADLIRFKSQFLWGPKKILLDLRPFLLVSAGAAIVLAVLPGPATGNAFLALLFLGVLFWVIYAFWQAAKMSWRGLFQAFLYTTFLGPLSLVEAVLSPPTAALLSRLVSRARVHEADERAIQLTADPRSLKSALQHVAGVEDGGSSPWLGERRYSLFVAPKPPQGRWPWLSRQQATHPSVSSRLERIDEVS